MPNGKRGGDKDMFKIKTNSFCDFLSNCEFNFNLYFEHVHHLGNINMTLLIESYYKIILTIRAHTVAVLGGGGGGGAMALGLALFMPKKGLALLPPPSPLLPKHLSECPNLFGKMSQSCPRCPQNGFN